MIIDTDEDSGALNILDEGRLIAQAFPKGSGSYLVVLGATVNHALANPTAKVEMHGEMWRVASSEELHETKCAAIRAAVRFLQGG